MSAPHVVNGAGIQVGAPRPLAVLDIQHRGKPGKWADRGATYPPGARLQDPHIEEVDLTHRYVLAADRTLRLAGFNVAVIADGAYRDRWQRSHDYGAAVHVACHVDSGGANRGSVLYDRRSPNGRVLADAVADALGRAVPWPVAAASCGPDTNGVPGDEGERGFSVIAGLYPLRPTGLVYEPGFIDSRNDQHRALLAERPELLGVALARGIAAGWARLVANAS
ncbi:N-acetylmuramoyl-L-alanine amidase [Myxococcota bacterium]|nr:N-acetylmuramoyl-L-alanine amidase [Myxococcota bacterium]